MNAKVTVEFVIMNVCDESDLISTGMTFEELVRHLVQVEGLMGLVDDEQLVKVEVYRGI